MDAGPTQRMDWRQGRFQARWLTDLACRDESMKKMAQIYIARCICIDIRIILGSIIWQT
jgi:hypothetical protein